MKKSKNFKICVFSLFTILFLIRCDSDRDFRKQYYGAYQFKVMTTHWMVGKLTTYDTSFYDGAVRKYKSRDRLEDWYMDDDSSEDSNDKITIEWNENPVLTPILNSDGSLVPKAGYRYRHYGEFSGLDTIVFFVDDNGLAGGWNHDIVGVRH